MLNIFILLKFIFIAIENKELADIWLPQVFAILSFLGLRLRLYVVDENEFLKLPHELESLLPLSD